MGKVIAICNQKGGVGKTVTTINLGVSLVKEGKKVLLVDFDPQSHTTKGLGLYGSPNIDMEDFVSKVDNVSNLSLKEISGVFRTMNSSSNSHTTYSLIEDEINGKDINVHKAILHHKEGIDLIPNTCQSSGLEKDIMSSYRREVLLKTVLDIVRDEYDYIFIDCLPSLGLMTTNALVAADSIIIPVEASHFGIDGMNMLFETIDDINKYVNPNLRIDGILITLVDKRNKEDRNEAEFTKNIYRNFFNVYETVIPKETKVKESTRLGISSLLHNFNGNASEAYRHLAKEIIENDKNNKQAC